MHGAPPHTHTRPRAQEEEKRRQAQEAAAAFVLAAAKPGGITALGADLAGGAWACGGGGPA